MRFVLRRAGFFLLTLWVAVTLNFFLPRMMPGNPAIAMMGKFRGKASPQELQALETIFGVNSGQSLPAQYVHYLGDVFSGNFGTSLFFFPEPVSQVIRGAVFWTLGLVGVTTVLAFALGTGIGILAAWRRGGADASIAPPLLVITSAIPYFWVGMMFILIFGLKLQWLPWSGGMSLTDTPAWTPSYIGDVAEHALLPALALLITTIGTWTLTMRNNMVTTLAEDYARRARARTASCSIPPRVTRSCRTSPASRCHSASWSAVRS